MIVEFELDGQRFTALNGGPQFKFNEAVSFQIACETQEDVDHYWSKLTDGGEEGPCGWLKDRFGVSWQVVPTAMPRLLGERRPGAREARHDGDLRDEEARHRRARARGGRARGCLSRSSC